MITSKNCKECGEEKSIDEFYVHVNNADGRMGVCKKCRNKYVKKNYHLRREKFLKEEKNNG